jgi:hypothetical protein
MKPAIGKYYYIDYEDKKEPEANFMGIARCVGKYERDETGKDIYPVLYEFEHTDNHGNLTLSLFYEREILMPASN